MSNIQDMNNRMKQNRDLRPSKRQKFKENNRGTIYASAKQGEKPSFKEFSEFQIKSTISKIRAEAKARKRFDLILMISLFGIAGLFIVYLVFAKENTVLTDNDNKAVVDNDNPPAVIWSGRISDPLELPFSNLYYAPKIKGWGLEAQNEQEIEINSRTMVADSTTNILFFDNNCNLIRKLLPEDGNVTWMYVGPRDEELGPKKNLYALAKDDTNNDGLINDEDIDYLFISELDGKDLSKITNRRVESMEWIGSGNELLIEFPNQGDFFNPEKQKDSLYGIYNTETKTLRLTNQIGNKKNVAQQ